ncbi:hypothetical protein BJ508DRAFT_228743 [Ascobolus immersus RN42]|uniref:U3 small nucleolar RNA-associated protein 10 n=1 Tax=Ascobolus immersus RN42 TaxID=1160509 RepID=A0A3N4HUQ9_ASCIM|nr:hypothetical protein BJ508DRAFT_228743 [Ascobolus immersus RN42]
MASSLASQLQRIAASTASTLSAKKAKSLHSTSLLFPPSHAASQDFETIYSIALDGYRELCALDPRFEHFSTGIFSESSKSIDRYTQTKAEIQELDRSCTEFLQLASAWVRLKPTLKAIEWLVRRFRVHIHIPIQLLLTFLPHHGQIIFIRIIEIIPENSFPNPFGFLRQFRKSVTPPPKSLFTTALATRPDFFNIVSEHMVDMVKHKRNFAELTHFWASTTVEAVSILFEMTRSTSSKKTSSHAQKEEDVLIKLLPILKEGLKNTRDHEFQLACYMLIAVIVAKSRGLNEQVLSGLIQSVAAGWTEATVNQGLASVALLAQEGGLIDNATFQRLLEVPQLASQLAELSHKFRVDKLASGIVLMILDKIADQTLRTLEIAESILADVRLSVNQKKKILSKLISVASNAEVAMDGDVSSRLGDIVIGLAEGRVGGKSNKKKLAALFHQILEDEKIDVEILELKLGGIVKPLQIEASKETAPQEKTVKKAATYEELSSRIPSKTTVTSFLGNSHNGEFNAIFAAFAAAIPTEADLKKFYNLEIFSKRAITDAYTISFFAAVWSGKHPVLAKTAALARVKEIVNDVIYVQKKKVDYQALIPHILIALQDTNKRVRAEAANLLAVLEKTYKIVGEKKAGKVEYWAVSSIYGDGAATKDLKWCETADVRKFLELAIAPGLEECVLEQSVIVALVRQALSSSKVEGATTLKKSVKTSVLGYLSSHVICTPSLVAKVSLLAILNTIEKASTSRTEFLLPVLKWYCTADQTELRKQCELEDISIESVEKALVSVVSEHDKVGGVEYLVDLLEKKHESTTLQAIAATRIQAIWNTLRPELQIPLAVKLLTTGVETVGTGAEEALALFRSVKVPRDAFIFLLDASNLILKDIVGSFGERDMKRRRVDGKEVTVSSEQAATDEVRKTTLVLETLASEKIEGEDGKIIASLFGILAEVLILEAELGVGIAYLVGVLLGCLINMVKDVKQSGSKHILQSSVRADVLISCIRSSSSPQIHNSALLLVSAIADVAPELVLHSVMPIFTFMGANVLRQDDDYSARVIELTIRKVIPPLLSSLQAEGVTPLSGASELIASFVSAYMHIPVHRRQWLYVELVETLGAKDYLFAVVSMLAEKFIAFAGTTSPARSKALEVDPLESFCASLTGQFDAVTQVATVEKILTLVKDVLKPQPGGLYSQLMASSKEANFIKEKKVNPKDTAKSLLDIVKKVLTNDRLKFQIAAVSKEGGEVKDLFSNALQLVLGLCQEFGLDKDLKGDCDDTLKGLLRLLATKDFVAVIETLVDRNDRRLQQSALATFRERILAESRSEKHTKEAVVKLADKIALIIADKSLDDASLKVTALLCVDAIIVKFGKADPALVEKTVRTIVQAGLLDAAVTSDADDDLAIESTTLVVLASAVIVLGGRFIQFLPLTVPKSIAVTKHKLTQWDEDDDVEDGTLIAALVTAAFAFWDELIRVVPSFMTNHLGEIIVQLSRAHHLDISDITTRQELLSTIAEKADVKIVLRDLTAAFNSAVTLGEAAITVQIELLEKLLDHASKQVVQKNTASFVTLWKRGLDLRREIDAESSEIDIDDEILDRVEDRFLKTVLKTVYKLNDGVFRPVFTGLFEWADEEVSGEEREARLSSFWRLVRVLSENLKGLFTDYFGGIVHNAIAILKERIETNKRTEDDDDVEDELWVQVLHALKSGAEFDESDFFQLHHETLSTTLLSLLPLAPTQVLPTLLPFLITTQTEDHNKVINTAILKLMKDDENLERRKAGVRALARIYEELGEEWIGLLPETVPVLAECLEDDDEGVEREVRGLVKAVEGVLGEGELEGMLT